MKTRIIILIIIMFFAGVVQGQQSGSIWVKSNKPGSANFNDETIDKNIMAFVDSLMARDDIVVTFLGGADNLKWKGFSDNFSISQAIDQAKKLERALMLRSRYNKGEVGVTDEPVRGVKVVWSPKPPDIFELREDVDYLQTMNDSLINLMAKLDDNQQEQFAAFSDSLYKFLAKEKSLKDEKIEPGFMDWEIKTGVLAWTGGSNYDLAVPSIGIALKRMYWAFGIHGGFTPWSQQDPLGERGDAILLGTISLLPRKMIGFKTGFFSGWEFLAKTDNWTMKVLGVTAGPSLKWKYFECYVGYSFSRLSSLIQNDQWNHGLFMQFNFKFLIN